MTAPTVLIGRRTRKNDNNVYILGAGFSADAGLPLISDFLNHMRAAADWLADNHRDDERAAVERVLEFRHNAASAGYRVNVDPTTSKTSSASPQRGRISPCAEKCS